MCFSRRPRPHSVRRLTTNVFSAHKNVLSPPLTNLLAFPLCLPLCMCPSIQMHEQPTELRFPIFGKAWHIHCRWSVGLEFISPPAIVQNDDTQSTHLSRPAAPSQPPFHPIRPYLLRVSCASDPGGRYQADWDEPPGVGVPVREVNQGGEMTDERQGGWPGKSTLGLGFQSRLGGKVSSPKSHLLRFYCYYSVRHSLTGRCCA